MAALPREVAALIDAMEPGEELVITRDGEPIATIETPPTVAGPRLGDEGVTVVATAMKLSASARRSLSDELGADYIVLDMYSAPATADVLLVPPVSPQLIGSLRAMFPNARVIVAEFEDAELGISYEGPLRRMLDAGVDNYLAATAVPRLARQLHHAVAHHAQLTSGATPVEIAPAEET
ncbi:hypothetical protein [Labedaea rhizosphaerae]|uniref:Uncharacterized protein n=1 Tax=Labedaea rhizosphaerae TaxID=598644 RepID=A0A4R6RXX8_LABRH|nr:hypothetical protein [Labedaea rhizosphaerae]TDP91066.1 hypothetical protein EV186_10958 [Labedaea rhizosphaerae]